MDEVILRSGDADRGGLILNRGNLELDDVRLGLSHADDDGGAIHSSGLLIMRDCALSDSDATRGGALFNDGGEVLMFASSVTSNEADQGGGVFGVNGDFVMHDDSAVIGNSARQGGGMYFQDASYHGDNSIFGGTVAANIADEGGGVFMEGGVLEIEFSGGRGPGDSSAVSGNLAHIDGGGIYVDPAATLEVKTDNRISQNVAIQRGGGIYNLGRVFLRESSAVDGGLADGGGGVYNGGLLALFGSARIEDNGAYHSGGGVYNTTNATLRIWDNPCRIEDNTAVLAHGSGAGGGVANFGSGVVDALSIEIVGNQPDDLVNLP
jgi:hypothetical protein